ncbi:MAG: bifunctional adenosylcobinamide kinase/adenosylcobinamide-phosphate guanylyltransferase [Deltaproteobacteria bacterium]|nr:bifunctional adenosylcobinamide kinase/adenosylcobinamide-phosphate guanylyltransferase [Deltaproteobacteria bacterium]
MDPSTDKEIILVLGGARSGKSSWALRYAEETYASCLFVATAQVEDDEMAERVRLHQASRGPGWRLIEEPLDIAETLQSDIGDADVALIDCMTIWLSNILLQKGREAVNAYQDRLLKVLSRRRQAVIMVSNEVGTGIVPEYPLGREFRDLAGTLNQKLAALADKVIMSVAGIPIHIK